MNIQELQQLQALPLELKVLKTKQRIREYVYHLGGVDNVYFSFSGGKDSTVLANLIRSEFPNMEAVFVDTGLEFPEIKEFVKTFKNVKVLKPTKDFKTTIEEHGYPVLSKILSASIRKIRTQNLSEKYKNKLLYGDERGSMGKIPGKYHNLLNAPFKISEQCCDMLKKKPVKLYEKETGKFPITGEMAEESSLRKKEYIKYGCNAFDKATPKSTPLGFWTEQDILEYILINNLKIASVYGEIIRDESGKLKTTGEHRTGCMFCMFGVHLEKGENRFQRMKRTHPQIYDYCINKLKIGEVLDYIGVKY